MRVPKTATDSIGVRDDGPSLTKSRIPIRDARGSIWRKWDLHVHTPASLISEFGGDTDKTWDKYVDALRRLPSNIRVLGINDYIFIDGYRRLRELWEGGALPNIDLLLPVIELRIDKFGGTESALRRLNYHVIFADSVPMHAIEEQFIARLKATYILNSEHGHISWSGAPTKKSLEDLGRRIIDSVDLAQRHKYGSSLIEGFNNFNVSLESIGEALKSHYFANLSITAVGKTEWAAIKWQDGSIAEKKTAINGADLVFMSGDAPDGVIKSREQLRGAGVNSRLLDCSDAHHYAESSHKDRLGNCFTWIKADPTFDGLRHVLADFDERVFIGEEPPLLRRVRESPTRTLGSIELRKRSGSTLPDPWFDGVSIELNPGLVAIIGNKGSGKSALLDIMGLLGDSARQAHASFLSGLRFRRPHDNKAREFEAKMTWAAGEAEWRALDTDVASSAVERVAYIPQSLFESICNELETATRGKFDEELKRVIYSHVDETERLGRANLDDWIEYRASELQAAIEERRLRLAETNRRIVALEQRLEAEFRAQLQAQRDQLELELKAHQEARPIEAPKPTGETTAEIALAIQQIGALTEQRNSLVAFNEQARTRLADVAEREAACHLIAERLARLEREVAAIRDASARELQRLGITFESLVRLEVTSAPIVKLQELAASERKEAELLLDPDNEAGLPRKLEAVDEQIRLQQEVLDQPNRLFQAYQQEMAAWELRRSELVGDQAAAGTLLYIMGQLAALDLVPGELEKATVERTNIARQILILHLRGAELLRRLYQPVQRFIDDSTLAQRTMKLSFYATVQDRGFAERFLDMVHQGRIGSFAGKEEGDKQVELLLAKHELSTVEGAIAFAEEVVTHLKHDLRDTSRPASNRIDDQLKASQTVEGLYDFLFGFAYLEPRYGLQFGGRELHELSPGEKGAVLLVFYLLVDRADIPLLIDQPEENLDNETVYSLLVPSIRLARNRRQVVIVTHNPNLAVVCDAEQIVYAARASEGETRVTYETGAIENPEINRRVVDVLEGTRPAFDNRNDKYM